MKRLLEKQQEEKLAADRELEALRALAERRAQAKRKRQEKRLSARTTRTQEIRNMEEEIQQRKLVNQAKAEQLE